MQSDINVVTKKYPAPNPNPIAIAKINKLTLLVL